MKINNTTNDFDIEQSPRPPDAFVKLPLLPLRGITVIPGMTLHFDVGRKRSIAALEAAMESDQTIFLVAQREMKDTDPEEGDLYRVGCIAMIKQVLRLPGDNVRVQVEGLGRAQIESVERRMPYFEAFIKAAAGTVVRGGDKIRAEALVRHIQTLFDDYVSLVPRVSSEIVMNVMAENDLPVLCDYVAANLMLKLADKQQVLEAYNPLKRGETVCVILEREIEILDIEREIHGRVREQVEKNQREYYLREQVRAIQNELGHGDNPITEYEEYADNITALKLPDEAEEKLLKEAERLSHMQPGSAEGTVIRTYLDTCLELPWNKQTRDRLDLKAARTRLDRDHYGLSKVKERIIEYMAVRKLKPDLKGQILCLVGPPGVGKTSVAISVAKAMGRKYARVSLGGVRDEADIRGHRKTYIGAMPGRIMSSLKQAGARNAMILLDEVDKMGHDFRGDPSAALLEVLDSEQNHAFRDHYIELPFDLSGVFFVTTANTTDTIPRPLLDRMEIIHLGSYTNLEKLNIAKKHLVKKQLAAHGLTRADVKIDDRALLMVIDGYTRESGVRNLEREIAAILRKAAAAKAQELPFPKVTPAQLEGLLGPVKFKPEQQDKADEAGVVTGLAWTSVGGETLRIEVNVMEGTGKLELTGSLGEVMKESARAALSYIRSRSELLGIDKSFYKNKDIHIHVPEGAIPKDGPSAGITIATALVSALLGVPARRDVAMTGEITLRGRVLPIGGLNEKCMAALRYGVKTVMVPDDNRADLAEIDSEIKDKLNFIFVRSMDEVLPAAIRQLPRPKKLIAGPASTKRHRVSKKQPEGRTTVPQ